MKKKMKIKAFIDENTKTRFPKVPKGHAKTVEDFFRECMQKAAIMPCAKAIVGWHDLLVGYMNKKSNRLIVRLHEGVRIEGVLETRRGAITQMGDGFEYVFASNYFARIIYTMAYLGYVPTLEDFEDMINNRRICISYPRHVNPGEQEISAYTSKMKEAEYAAPSFYTPGWYLAHIVGVKNAPYDGYGILKFGDIEFLKPGNRMDWKSKDGLPIRKIKGSLNDSQKVLLKAHFLRFLDPINYFLVPSSNLIRHDSKVKKIGEDSRVVKYAQSMIRAAVEQVRLGVYDDFCKRALVPACDKNDIDAKQASDKLVTEFSPVPVIGKNAGKNVNEQKEKKEVKHAVRAYKVCESRLTEVDLIGVLRAYLVEGKSFRSIEHDVLKLEFKVRGGGFKAKKILNELGVGAEDKGMLSTAEAEAYVENCGDPLASFLRKL